MCDVIDAMVLVARRAASRVFFLAVKSGPQSTVTFTETPQQYIFRRNRRNSQGIVLKNQLMEMLAIDEGREEARPQWIIEIDQFAQVEVVSQRLAQEVLIVVISGLRPTPRDNLHLRNM